MTGTFVVPTPQVPSGGSGAYYASAWVGIDGDTCGNAILQPGLDFNVDGSRVSYDGEPRYPRSLPFFPPPLIAERPSFSPMPHF